MKLFGFDVQPVAGPCPVFTASVRGRKRRGGTGGERRGGIEGEREGEGQGLGEKEEERERDKAR